jgi:hypothetical protein
MDFLVAFFGGMVLVFAVYLVFLAVMRVIDGLEACAYKAKHSGYEAHLAKLRKEAEDAQNKRLAEYDAWAKTRNKQINIETEV